MLFFNELYYEVNFQFHVLDFNIEQRNYYLTITWIHVY